MGQTITVRTELEPVEAIDALWHGHQEVIGGPCPIPLLEILSAQSALETGRWHAMWNFNFGNLRGNGDSGEWIVIRGADEIIDGHRVTGPAVEGGFAAYRDRYSGARAFIRFLGTASHPPAPNRFQLAWDAATTGDVYVYCRELKAHGYFTADLDRYTKGVRGTVDWLRSGPMDAFLETLKP